MRLSFQKLKNWVYTHQYKVFAPLVALIFIVLWIELPATSKLENLTNIWRFKTRALLGFDPPADPRIVLLGIDDHSIDVLGRWVWPRITHADFLNSLALAKQNPTVVAYDVLFVDPEDKNHDLSNEKVSAGDQKLGETAGLLPSVVTGAFYETASKTLEEDQAKSEKILAQAFTQPIPLSNIHGDIKEIKGGPYALLPIQPLIDARTEFGFVNDDPDPGDGVRYKVPMIVSINGKIYPSLSLQVVCKILHVDLDKVKVDVGKNITLMNSSKKTWIIPISYSGELLINYRNDQNFTRLSLASVYQGLEKYLSTDPKIHAPLPANFNLNRKAVVIGVTASAGIDLGLTPLDTVSPLVLTHINAINNVLKNDYVKVVPTLWVILAWLVITWISLFRTANQSIAWTVTGPVLLMSFYTFFGFLIFWLWSWEIELVWPMTAYTIVKFGAVVLRWRQEAASKQQIKNIFARMSSAEVLDHILENPDDLQLSGKLLPVTVLFSDIRDYTKFSEGTSEHELVNQLNRYFERMVYCVKSRRGRLDKFIGDAIMACWSDIPVVSLGIAEDAKNAIRCALDMRRNLRELNEERTAIGQIPLKIGIGVNHGDVVAGLIGASSRQEFTVIGDAVNVASRLEGLTKEFKTDLAIGESIRGLVGETFMVRRLGYIVLKGKTKPTMVYEVLAERKDNPDTIWTEEAIFLYEEALNFFFERNFADAESFFLGMPKNLANDYCVQNYCKACAEFQINPPTEDWDGRIVMTSK